MAGIRWKPDIVFSPGQNCNPSGLQLPVWEYGRSFGVSVPAALFTGALPCLASRANTFMRITAANGSGPSIIPT